MDLRLDTMEASVDILWLLFIVLTLLYSLLIDFSWKQAQPIDYCAPFTPTRHGYANYWRDNKKCYGIFEKGLQVQVGPKMERMFSHRNKLKFNTFVVSSFYDGNNFKLC